ncbi:MAG: hypothetical protein LH606_16610 [Cytophagaceae bacterium]|nr:hypothetical protein [Cytophagaceae bacterium]
MSEPTDADKRLHDWVRQTLHSNQPAEPAQDWERLQRALRRRRWGRVGALVLVGLLVGLVAWIVLNDSKRQSSPTLPTEISPGSMGIESNVSAANCAPSRKMQRVKPKSKPTPPTKLVATSRLRPLGQTSLQTPVSLTQPERIELASPGTLAFRQEAFTLKTGLAEQLRQQRILAHNSEEAAIEHQMLTGDFGPDSTSYHALSRNLRRWPDAVIVCDLTSSMYPYSTQLFAWFKKNARNPAVKGLVFFTDCDSLGRQTYPGGPAGQFFVTRERDAVNALPILLAAARNTLINLDRDENDVEALLFAQKTFPDAKHLILLADNSSGVKDLATLDRIRKPVHVVLCGTPWDSTRMAFQPDHFTIASRMRGSLHTIEDDLKPTDIVQNTVLRVGSTYYRYNARKARFKATRFRKRPIRVMGLFWL